MEKKQERPREKGVGGVAFTYYTGLRGLSSELKSAIHLLISYGTIFFSYNKIASTSLSVVKIISRNALKKSSLSILI
jgi:hypothetical protein